MAMLSITPSEGGVIVKDELTTDVYHLTRDDEFRLKLNDVTMISLTLYPRPKKVFWGWWARLNAAVSILRTGKVP